MLKFLLFIWQLPQNLIGLFILLIHNRDRIDGERYVKGKRVRFWYVDHFFRSGISLGNFIFLDKIYLGMTSVQKDIQHEHGHSIQSKYLGPLYLLIIGLPSLVGNIISRIFLLDSRWYYNQPWEKWADELGGVIR